MVKRYTRNNGDSGGDRVTAEEGCDRDQRVKRSSEDALVSNNGTCR
jgi:hypothetical protein